MAPISRPIIHNPSQCPERFWAIVGRNPSVPNSIWCMSTSYGFSLSSEAYSLDSPKTMANFPKVLMNFNRLFISQTQSLEAGSSRSLT